MSEKTQANIQHGRAAHELSEGTLTPVADIYETEAELVLVADVPGAVPGEVNIQVDKGVLTLEAESTVDVPAEQYARTYVGFHAGTYFRAFALSDEIDRERITAEVANGVVTVHLPKAASAQIRKIEVKAT